MNKLLVRFSARDEDGSVRLSRNDELTTLDGHLTALLKGAGVFGPNKGIRAIGNIIKRNDIWVVVISQWLDDASWLNRKAIRRVIDGAVPTGVLV